MESQLAIRNKVVFVFSEEFVNSPFSCYDNAFAFASKLAESFSVFFVYLKLKKHAKFPLEVKSAVYNNLIVLNVFYPFWSSKIFRVFWLNRIVKSVVLILNTTFGNPDYLINFSSVFGNLFHRFYPSCLYVDFTRFSSFVKIFPQFKLTLVFNNPVFTGELLSKYIGLFPVNYKNSLDLKFDNTGTILFVFVDLSKRLFNEFQSFLKNNYILNATFLVGSDFKLAHCKNDFNVIELSDLIKTPASFCKIVLLDGSGNGLPIFISLFNTNIPLIYLSNTSLDLDFHTMESLQIVSNWTQNRNLVVKLLSNNQELDHEFFNSVYSIYDFESMAFKLNIYLKQHF